MHRLALPRRRRELREASAPGCRDARSLQLDASSPHGWPPHTSSCEPTRYPLGQDKSERRGRPSQGVEPWGEESVFGDGSIAGSSLVFRQPSLVVGDRVSVAIGQKLYRSVLLNAASWSNWTQVADLGPGVGVSDLVYHQGNILLLCGRTRDIALFNTTTLAVTTPFAGLKSATGVSYGGALVCGQADAGVEHALKMVGGVLSGNQVTFDLDSPIVRVALFQGKVAIATRSGLYTLQGRPIAAAPDDPAIAGDQSRPATWSEEPQPFVTNGVYVADEDFKFLVSHGGRLYTWLSNQVMEFNPSSQRDGWRAVGLEGKSTYGATVAGGHLIVTLTTRAGDTETWAWEGSGWWLLLRAAEGSAATRC